MALTNHDNDPGSVSDHDANLCWIDPCPSCQAEQRERDRYYDELWERKQKELAFKESDLQQQDPFLWALNEIDKIFQRAKVK
jgi:hypothetical protein